MQLVRAIRRFGAIMASAWLMAALPHGAAAQIGSARYAAVVVDPQTGRVLFGSNADAPRHPASLTKMMTLYMLFDALRRGEMTLNQRLEMTPTAASRPPSKLGLPPGRTITVENAIYALVTKSANDVASLLGETMGGGSEARFAQMMTLRARAIGMSGTTFRNASGLPDIDQVTTAHDMATLGLRLQRDFPERYHYFGTRQHSMGNVVLRNHNRMLDAYEGVDGIKTGYVDASGFNIVSSARRDNVRLIVAVFGGKSWIERDRHAAALLDRGFAQMGVGDSGVAVASASPARGAMLALATGTAAAATVRAASSPSARIRPRSAVRPAVNGAPVAARRPLRLAAAQAARAPVAARRAARTVVEQGDGGGRVKLRLSANRKPSAQSARPPARRSPAR